MQFIITRHDSCFPMYFRKNRVGPGLNKLPKALFMIFSRTMAESSQGDVTALLSESY